MQEIVYVIIDEQTNKYLDLDDGKVQWVDELKYAWLFESENRAIWVMGGINNNTLKIVKVRIVED